MTIQTPLQLVITIGIIALGTFLIRALPFFLFPAGKETPRVVAYLGAALPSASIAMLIVYCFKNVSVFSGSHGLPELISAVFVIVVHKWRHNLLLSIVGGTLTTIAVFLPIGLTSGMVFSSAGIGLPFFRRFCLHPVQRHCCRVRL